MLRTLLLFSCFTGTQFTHVQSVPEEQLGAWYVYFYTAQFGGGTFGVYGMRSSGSGTPAATWNNCCCATDSPTGCGCSRGG